MQELVGLVEPTARLTLEGLLNFLWQGTALAFLVLCLLRLIPGSSAATRYAVWYATLAVLLCLPLVTIATRMGAAQPATTLETSAVLDPQRASPDEPRASASGASSLSRSRLAIPLPGGVAAVLVVGGWAIGVLFLGVRLVRSCRRMLKLKRNSKPLADADATRWTRWFAACFTRRGVQLRSSDDVPLPMVAGLTKPAILFPAALVCQLSPEEKFRICLHELAHIRRWDDWTNLGQKVIEAVLFFHPAVRWIGGRLSLEREIACDEWAVSITGAARPYAACLARLVELASTGAHPSPALGSAPNKKQIFRRVEMLLNRKRDSKSGLSKPVFAAALVACLAASVMLARMSPVITVEEYPTVPPAAPVQAAPPEAPLPPQAPVAKPVPAPAPAPQPEPAVEVEREIKMITERVHPIHEEIHKLVEQIHEQVRTQIHPNTEEIHKLTEQIHANVQESIQPAVQEIHRLAQEMGRQRHAEKPDEEAIRKLEEQIREQERVIEHTTQERIRGLEEQIRAHTEKIRPAEAQIRELETKIHELEKQLRLEEKQIREREKQMRAPKPPAAPQPPAGEAPPAPPEPPVAPR